MTPERAQELIANASRNRDVLFPYINGQDLNNRPDCSGSRWVINFNDWSLDVASSYREPFAQVEREVKPERLVTKRDARRKYWWRYAERAPGLYKAIEGLNRVIAITRVSKVVLPVTISTRQVFSEQIVVFATDDTGMLSLLSSAPHYCWTIERASTLETRIRYTPSDVFDTLARPDFTDEMRAIGDRLDTFRGELMLSRQVGLTATYNLVHDPACTDADIAELREIHGRIDEAVCRAYGWDDLLAGGLDHGFHDTRQGVRYTVGPVVRQEILDRLLELNHERYAAEQRSGAGGKRKTAQRTGQPELFG